MGIGDDIKQAFGDISDTIQNAAKGLMNAVTGNGKEAMALAEVSSTQRGQSQAPMANISVSAIKEQAQSLTEGMDVLNVGEASIDSKSPDAAQSEKTQEQGVSL